MNAFRMEFDTRALTLHQKICHTLNTAKNRVRSFTKNAIFFFSVRISNFIFVIVYTSLVLCCRVSYGSSTLVCWYLLVLIAMNRILSVTHTLLVFRPTLVLQSVLQHVSCWGINV